MVKTKNYQNGKIYQIMDSAFNCCYIGSTIDKLSNRLNSHRSKYRKYKEGKGGFTTIYKMFDEYGEMNRKIYLIENYPCQSQDELFAREGFHQRKSECVNKCIAGRTHKEYRQDNKEKLAQQNKEWVNNNQEHVKQYKREYILNNRDKQKEWKENNKDKKKEQDKQYRENNKDKLKQYFCNYNQIHKERKRAYRQQEYHCQCGVTICLSSKPQHLRSEKHQEWVKKQEPEEEPLQQLD